ncbi:MAG: DUF2062 domain-containing protein [Alphaproteobacteria bacterium]
MTRSLSALKKVGRLIKYRLIVPMWRSASPPEHKARGVAVGFAWAMTPLVGIQMWLVLMTWAAAKKVFHWSFSLPLALAWTWVTNVFTLVPIYYIFYVTGQIMRGKWESIGAYGGLRQTIADTFTADMSWSKQGELFFKLLLKDWGLSMAVGCLPWAIAAYVCGYYLTLKVGQAKAHFHLKKRG